MLLVLAEPAQTSCREVQNLATAHLKKLRHKIITLVKLEAMLADAVAQCSGKSSPSCPVLELLKASDSSNWVRWEQPRPCLESDRV
jgi:MerR family transcriptional regulator, mercuric resistance operon regulatory protein